MKRKYLCLLWLLFGVHGFATEWHVTTSGLSTNLGTLASPWNLQTALNHSLPTPILGGDIIWLHAGQYNGRFLSNLTGMATNHITVCAWPGDLVTINGFTGTGNGVLTVIGGFVDYMNFEITCKNAALNRDCNSASSDVSGLIHTGGECNFINLVIYDNPHAGVMSGHDTEGTEFYGCLVYNNGCIYGTSTSSAGVGFYVQNASNVNTRRIDNCFVFNNYYKGMELWSACDTGCLDVVKNITVTNSSIFNTSSPVYGSANNNKNANMIIATDDDTGVNRAHNITISNNFFYHTSDFLTASSNGEGPSIQFGFSGGPPVHDVSVINNFLYGKNPALEIFNAETLTLTKNKVWGKYFFIHEPNVTAGYVNGTNWKFSSNHYWLYWNFTTPGTSFRFYNTLGDLTFAGWNALGLDTVGSQYDELSNAQPIDSENKIVRNIFNPNQFFVTLFNKPGANMTRNFLAYFPAGTPYTIRDIENYHAAPPSPLPTLSVSGDITFDMQSTALELPSNNTIALKSANNFGVFIIEFDYCPTNKTITDQVYSGAIDFKQASNSITATNIIETATLVVYHAGSFVDLQPGFDAAINSDFTAYVQGCTDIFLYRNKHDVSPIHTAETFAEEPQKATESLFSIYPNPTNGMVNIKLGANPIRSISIYSFDGKLIASDDRIDANEYNVDLSNYGSGIYFVTIFDKSGAKYNRKIVKN